MLRGEFNRLQEVLSRAWGRSIRDCWEVTYDAFE